MKDFKYKIELFEEVLGHKKSEAVYNLLIADKYKFDVKIGNESYTETDLKNNQILKKFLAYEDQDGKIRTMHKPFRMYTMTQVNKYYGNKKTACQEFVVGKQHASDIKTRKMHVFVDEAHELKEKAKKFLQHLNTLKHYSIEEQVEEKQGGPFMVFATATPDEEIKKLLFRNDEVKKIIMSNCNIRPKIARFGPKGFGSTMMLKTF